jgi:hypothetical protein
MPGVLSLKKYFSLKSTHPIVCMQCGTWFFIVTVPQDWEGLLMVWWDRSEVQSVSESSFFLISISFHVDSTD